jgi:ADP-heptose:LPS heptosyltransferase
MALKMLGIDLKDKHLELWPSKEDEEYVDDFLNTQWLSPNQKLIGINISASPRWLTKSWPAKQMVKLCEELGFKDMRVILTGREMDIPYAESLVNSVKNTKLINACGRTSVNQLACLIRKCGVYISADSSPLHIASSVGTPFIALFGPTDPRRHLPPANNYILIKKDISCSPCYKPECKAKKCMELITAQEVLEAVEKLIK